MISICENCENTKKVIHHLIFDLKFCFKCNFQSNYYYKGIERCKKQNR